MASLLEKMRINTWESCGIIQFSGKPDTILVVQNRSQWYKTGVCSQCSAKREKERERERESEREREREREREKKKKRGEILRQGSEMECTAVDNHKIQESSSSFTTFVSTPDE